MERRTLIDRIRDWFAGRTRGEKPTPKEHEEHFWNEPAPASNAGDAPLITSHGEGPSHAH